MSRKPDIVIPPDLPANVRQVIVALAQRVRDLEATAATKQELASAGVVRIDANGNMAATVRPRDIPNNQR